MTGTVQLDAAFLEDGNDGPLVSLPFPDDIKCCSERVWYVASDGGAFGAIWEAQAGLQYGRTDSARVPESSAVSSSVTTAPTMAGRVGSDLWFVTCSQLVVLSIDELVLHDLELPGGNCAIGTTGEFRAKKAMSSAIVEGLNANAKLAVRKARGFRTYEAMETALHHLLGALPEPSWTHAFF